MVVAIPSLLKKKKICFFLLTKIIRVHYKKFRRYREYKMKKIGNHKQSHKLKITIVNGAHSSKHFFYVCYVIGTF